MADPLQYGPDYVEHVALTDGERVVVRCLRPDDRDLLLEGFGRMSPESRYYRFFSAKDRLTSAEVRYLTEIDGVHHFAIGAVRTLSDGTSQGMGLARFVRLPDRPDVAEPALAVADDCHRKGLGTLLFTRLVDAAAERGVRWFECHLLGDNHAMKAVLADVADEVTWRPGDEGGMIATFAVSDASGLPVPDPDRRASIARRLFEAAAEQVVSRVRAAFPEPGRPPTR